MMRKVATFAVALWLAACGSSGSPAEDTCKRADECNALRVSVKECVETIETALDSLTPTDADELEFEMNQCLDHPACGAFIGCFNDLVSREAGGGGSPGGGGGGGGGSAPPPPTGPGG
jgi:hypothetical protein